MEKTLTSDIPQEVPMFLRKTYHMIDSCDTSVACWSEDGQTFVVKDPSKFEKEIIPQFFKHSKFSSFVRQLNFYSFRKIKYADTIRLDPKLEAETANFWRFRHENFQRGRPDLLTDIKRMTAAQSKAAAAAAAAAASKVSPDAAHSSSATTVASPQSQAMKSEIDTLKKQLEEMNRNMSELTCMVQQVSLTSSPPEPLGNKRKKVEAPLLPESVGSLPTSVSTHNTPALGDDALEVFMDACPDDIMFANDDSPMRLIPESKPASRESSTDTSLTDTDFVDRLFTVFGDDENQLSASSTKMEEELPAPEPVGSFSYPPLNTSTNDNRPDSELMERLSEALAVLPKEMQEQIVNRLVASIVSNNTKPFPSHSTVPSDEDATGDEAVQTPESDVIGMPLAAATLASLLSYYSNLVQETKAHQQQHDSKHSAVKTSIPVAIPCHA